MIIDGEPSGTLRGGCACPIRFPFNLTGHPALAMPCGKTPEGLPIALQIVGRWHADEQVLAAAAALLEAALR